MSAERRAEVEAELQRRYAENASRTPEEEAQFDEREAQRKREAQRQHDQEYIAKRIDEKFATEMWPQRHHRPMKDRPSGWVTNGKKPVEH